MNKHKSIEDVAEEVRAHLDGNKQKVASVYSRVILHALIDLGYVICASESEEG